MDMSAICLSTKQLVVEPTTATPDFWDYALSYRPLIEAALERNLPLAPGHIGSGFNEAVRFAVFPGGKRLRPVLTMLGAELYCLPGTDVCTRPPLSSTFTRVH